MRSKRMKLLWRIAGNSGHRREGIYACNGWAGVKQAKELSRELLACAGQVCPHH